MIKKVTNVHYSFSIPGTFLALNIAREHDRCWRCVQMKIKIILLMITLFLTSFLLLSMRFEYLEPETVMIVPNNDGNPMVVLSDGGYLIRDWSFQAGCYRLIKIGIFQYNLATPADPGKCSSPDPVLALP
jgi:hypothetical protein